MVRPYLSFLKQVTNHFIAKTAPIITNVLVYVKQPYIIIS